MTDSLPSHPITVASVPPEGLDVELVADAAALAALAAGNDVESVEALTARLHLRPFGRDGLEVTGAIEAAATRICVVSLDPFQETVREDVSARFAPSAPEGGEFDLSDDPAEPLVGGAVDLWALTAEFFTLALNPHPRKPGVAFAGDAGASEAESPFAALKRLVRPEGDPS